MGSKGEPPVTSIAHKGLAIQLLQKAIELDSSNGKTWYLLGRCQAAVNRVQDAFRAYRSSIDKTEASADTWFVIESIYCSLFLSKNSPSSISALLGVPLVYSTRNKINQWMLCKRTFVLSSWTNVM